MIIGCNNIAKSFEEKVILKNINFNIEANEKVALVGNNGAGKTTLFKILTKEMVADTGEVFYAKNCSIGYLKQHMELDSTQTVYDELLHVFDEVIALEKQLTELETKIATTQSMDLTHTYDELRQVFESKKGYQYKSLIHGVLKGLGFDENIYNEPISILSGGQKTRVSLAKLLLQEPSILLLDEPTNHLDIEAIEWLENFLKSYNGAVLIISHDRYFLDKVVTKVIQIELGKSSIYYGNYEHFIIESAKAYEVAVHHYQKQQQETARQQQVIAKLRQFNREKSIKRARSREKLLAKQEPLEAPLIDNKPMNLVLAPRIISGNDVLITTDLAMGFENKPLFSYVNFEVKRGDKIAIVGPNGIGKTTLFRIIMDQLQPLSGSCKLGSKVSIGYYDQEHSTLNRSATIIEELQNAFPTLTNGHIRNVLAAFLFTGEDVFLPIHALSGGERGRVALAKIMLSEANFLILDEPTNHLDIMSKEVLERALTHYEGTVIYVSHDRYFINQTATKVLELQTNGMTTYLGDYDYYAEKKKELQMQQTPSNTSSVSKNTSKLDWQKQKELQAAKRKLQNNITTIEKDIEETETRMMAIDDLLCLEEVYTNFDRSNELAKEKDELDEKMAQLYEQWDHLNNTFQEYEQ